METARPTPTEEIDDVLTIHRKKDHNKAYAIIIIYDFFFMPSIHPHSTSIILFPPSEKSAACWLLIVGKKDRLPVVPEKGRKRKKKTTFCDIILISWVTSARVAFISFHMQILNITLRLVPENMECKNMDRDSVCFLICFFFLSVLKKGEEEHTRPVCARGITVG